MNASIHDGDDTCWRCFVPTSCCDCESSDSPWSKSTSQESLSAFDGSDEPAYCTVDGDYFLAGAFELPDFETLDGTIPRPGHESQRPCAASTQGDDDDEKWETPDAIHPPESSSPVVFDADSSPQTWTSCHEGSTMGRPLLCGPPNDGQWHIEAQFCADSKLPAFLHTTQMDSSFRTNSLTTVEELVRRQDAGKSQDVCAVTRQSSVGTNHPEVNRASAPGNIMPAFSATDVSSGSAIPALTIRTQPGPVSSHGTENHEPYDALTAGRKMRKDDSFSSKMPSETSHSTVSCVAQATNSLKRRRSSVDCFQGLKKAKPERTPHDPCSGNLNSTLRFKYQATKPASLRRAESLQSEISACSEGSFDSLFNSSPLSPPTFRPEEYPPTLPSTPFPSSVDYVRSRANPLARTIAVLRRRFSNVPAIPPVPIIAPPSDVPPPVIRGAEDHAIDRLEALLLRERSERERDGLNVHDKTRAERLIAVYGIDHALSRRGSASTSDSSDNDLQWEEETTCSATESQESQQLARKVKIQMFGEQHRLASRETWTTAYGIPNDFRKEVTQWILEKVPKEPESSSKNVTPEESPRGIDLYDQLMHSCQTRFHAAQLLHRYFLLPEKVEYWREALQYEYFDLELCEWCDDLDHQRGVWHLAAACIALSVKLHRDCLHPLQPVFAAEFLAMARYPMTHETFELAQRDILYSCQFQLGNCTPQDVLDELWNALPTLRKATAPVGWAIVQCVTWEKLFESLLEPDMLQYPVTLLVAAALIDSLVSALSRHYRKEEEASICKCSASCHFQDEQDDTVLWQIHHFEANQLVNDVILDIQDVLHLPPVRRIRSLYERQVDNTIHRWD